MKKLITLLTAFALFASIGCVMKPQSELPESTPSAVAPTQAAAAEEPEEASPEAAETEQPKEDVYAEVYSLYKQAAEERWDGNKLTENDMSILMLDCYGSIGYTYADLDKNGREEFIVALTDAFTDDYYGKLVLCMYSANEEGEAICVFSSEGRDRYYYAGENLFANIGSGSASVEFNMTRKLQGTSMIKMTTQIESSEYKQLELTAFG